MRNEKESTGVTEDSDAWPVIAGIRKKGKRGNQFSKISLKYWQIE